jgi:hypothetical protein
MDIGRLDGTGSLRCRCSGARGEVSPGGCPRPRGSKSWVSVLVARYRTGGYEALERRSRRAHARPNRTPERVEDEIIRVWKDFADEGFDAGAQTIHWHLSEQQSVGEGGLEPPHPFGHRNLNPARLPIPPLARATGRGYLMRESPRSPRQSAGHAREKAKDQPRSSGAGSSPTPFSGVPTGRLTPAWDSKSSKGASSAW